MQKRFALSKYGSQLWSREKAREVRIRLISVMETLELGDGLVVDAANVEAFDFSFAAELFGRMLATLGSGYPGRFLIVENLNECTRENLDKALESLNLAIIERNQSELKLLGKVHPADQETFAEIISSGEAVSAAALGKRLSVNLTAMNERLSKLSGLGVVRRERGSSASGREQFVYRILS